MLARFFARQGPPELDFEAPGLDFEVEKRRFPWFFVTRARSVLASCEVYETLHWLTKIEVRAFHDRNKNDEKSIRTPFELTHAFEAGSGTAPNAVWTVPGCQLGARDGQHGSQDGQLGGQDDPT